MGCSDGYLLDLAIIQAGSKPTLNQGPQRKREDKKTSKICLAVFIRLNHQLLVKTL